MGILVNNFMYLVNLLSGCFPVTLNVVEDVDRLLTQLLKHEVGHIQLTQRFFLLEIGPFGLFVRNLFSDQP